ncbi:MAG: hypothetical protein ACREN2_06165 [Candidatus Dormibacteria bacterium]
MTIALVLAYAAGVIALSALLSGVIWKRRGGSFNRGVYLGVTQPVVGVIMALWLTPDDDDEMQRHAPAR